jgi:uncharacterized repeat protein (TIGR01451 family)
VAADLSPVGQPGGKAVLVYRARLGASAYAPVTNRVDVANQASAAATVVPRVADLSLAQSHDNPNPRLGDEVNFTLELTNAGPTAAANILLEVSIGDGLAFLSAEPASAFDLVTGVWTVGDLQRNASASLLLRTRLLGWDNARVQAEVSAVDRPDPDSVPGDADPGQDDRVVSLVTSLLAIPLLGSLGMLLLAGMLVLITIRRFYRRI